MDVQTFLERHELIPHPEGGWYREIYRSEQAVLSPAAEKTRSAVTHIYFLLVNGQTSRFHKVVHDEIWNFYSGDPLQLIQYDGVDVSETVVGEAGGEFVAVVKGGVFQAALTTGAYSLVGCTVAPGFDFEDFSLLADDPEMKRKLLKDHPEVERFL